MARLFPEDPAELITGEPPRVTVEPRGPGGGSPRVELWERVVPFGGAAPDFRLAVADITGTGTFEREPVDYGDVYQALLYRGDEGSATGDGAVLGRLTMPAVVWESRGDMLTHCGEHFPLLTITPGGTYVSVQVATSSFTRVRVQLATAEPSLDDRNLPFFPPEAIVASAFTSRLLNHDLTLVDGLLEPDTHGHAPLLPGSELWFVVLAWNEDGVWDYVWGSRAVAPGNPPNFESITTRRRRITVGLTHLVCIGDGDPGGGDGEATFRFAVRVPGASAPLMSSTTWDPMPTGGDTWPKAAPFDIADPASRASRMTVEVSAADGNGTDGQAATDRRPVEFPVGRGAEDVHDRVVSLRSHPAGEDGDLDFIAEVTYSVAYE